MKYRLIICLLAAQVINTAHKQVNLIDEVIVKKNHIKIKINERFKKKYLHGNFFATYDKDINLEKLDYSVQVLPFICNVISIVWISGRTYYIDSLDEDFYNSLPTIKEVFRRMYPDTKWEGELIPRKLVKNTFTQPKVEPGEKPRTALLFSGGLDSATSSFYHRHEKQLLITINGHWDLPLYDKGLWEERRDELLAFGKKYGHQNSFVTSNYYEFLNRWVLDNYSHEITSWRIFTVEGIGWAGLCAPIMALKGYPILLHGSTITWEFNFPAAANPFIDDNLYFAGMRLKHDLFDMHRLEKCEYLAKVCNEEGLDRPYIRVCEERIVENCCTICQKCIRTIIQLVIAGEDPHKYGFNCNVESILKRSKKFMQEHGTGATTVWHFMHLKKRLKQKEKDGEPIPKGLEWLLTYNLKKKITSEIRNQRKLDWRTFVDLLPDIKVPDDIELGF